jgi:pullulanase
MRTSIQLAAIHFALAACASAAGAETLPTLQTCDAPEFQQVLQPGAAGIEARAVWLDHRLARWPGVDGGTFRLYHSASGAISAKAGAKVTGADGALDLDKFNGAIAPAAALRFKYVGDGALLALREADLARLPALHRGQLVLVQEGPDGSVRAATRIQSAGALDQLYAHHVQVMGAHRAPGIGVHLRQRQRSGHGHRRDAP